MLGLIFLRHADKRFTQIDDALAAQDTPPDEREAMDYHAEGVLLRLLAAVDLDGDAFGKVYEYFLGNFALKERVGRHDVQPDGYAQTLGYPCTDLAGCLFASLR